jgi:hypothetical protein
MLVEVLVTAAVAAVLLAVLTRAFSSVWSGIGAVREETEAMLVARAVIEASTPRTNLVPLAQDGMIGRYAWAITIASTGIQMAAVTQSGQPGQGQPTQPGATGQMFTPMQLSQFGQAQPGQQSPQDQQRPGGAQDEEARREPPWMLFRIAVAVRAPSGRRTDVETYRLSRPATALSR